MLTRQITGDHDLPLARRNDVVDVLMIGTGEYTTG